MLLLPLLLLALLLALALALLLLLLLPLPLPPLGRRGDAAVAALVFFPRVGCSAVSEAALNVMGHGAAARPVADAAAKRRQRSDDVERRDIGAVYSCQSVSQSGHKVARGS